METVLTSLLADIMREKKSTQPAKAYSYLRFSTPEQRAGDSLRRQTDLAKRYAEARGLVLDDQLTYHDLGVSGYSGANAQRGKLAEFLEAVEKGVVPRGSFLLVESLDRISRQNPYDALQILQRIVNGGVTLVTLMGEPKVYSLHSVKSSPMALMEFLLIATRAHEESATKQRRAKEAWKAAMAKAGKGESRGASACPSWIRASNDGQSWEPIPERVAVVRRIFELARNGTGKDSIAKLLNSEGVPTFNEAKQWWGSYINRILNNRAVIGEHTPREKIEDPDTGAVSRRALKPIKDYYPPAIPKPLWNDVTASQRTNPRRGKHAAHAVANVFGGIAKCPQCGATMTRVNKSGGNRAWPYLVCASAKAGVKDGQGRPVCAYKSVGYERVEAAFLEDVASVAHDAPKATIKGRQLERERDNLSAAHDEIVDQLGNLLRVAAKGARARPAALVEKIQELENARAKAATALEKLGAQVANLDKTLVATRLAEMKSLAKQLALAKEAENEELAGTHRTALNTVLRRLLSAVVVDYTDGVLRFQWLHAEDQPSELRYDYSAAAFGFVPQDTKNA
jgi:DNA invertase Pin-like site-specific DNA recombinase